jgi:hypothetical protein
MNDKLPASNLPVSIFGQVPRDQREQELEFFLSKQYNSVGLRIQNKLNIIDQQFGGSQATLASSNSIAAINSNNQQQTVPASGNPSANEAPTTATSAVTIK